MPSWNGHAAVRLIDLGPLPTTLIVSLSVAVVLLAVRIFFVQRTQRVYRREQRQESERTRAMILAYRALAGSFTPMGDGERRQVEEALAEVVLFGTVREVELALACVTALLHGHDPGCQPLIELMRTNLREQLGLEPLPMPLQVPKSGPAKAMRGGSRGNRNAAND